MITATILLAAYAMYCAYYDTDHTPNHGWMFWVKRAIPGAIIALLFIPGWVIPCIYAGALYAPIHRLMYNSIRGSDWYYISETSNGYDRFFHKYFGGPTENHRKQAGYAAYIFEAAVIALCLFLLWQPQHT